jgi:ArsR family transcriptional regulator
MGDLTQFLCAFDLPDVSFRPITALHQTAIHRLPRDLNTAVIIHGVTRRFTCYIVNRRNTMNEEEMAAVKARAIQSPAREKHDPLEISMLAKALAHPARLGIISLLHERQDCIGYDIVDRIGLAQSTISEHLHILKVAGIVTGEIDGSRVCYSLEPSALGPLLQLLNEITASPPSPIQFLAENKKAPGKAGSGRKGKAGTECHRTLQPKTPRERAGSPYRASRKPMP